MTVDWLDEKKLKTVSMILFFLKKYVIFWEEVES